MKVVVILDPIYPHLESLCAQTPVWAVETSGHRELAKMIWARRNPGDSLPDLTLFHDQGDPEANCLDILDTIQEHHPEMDAIEVIGTVPSGKIREVLHELGYGSIEEFKDGFSAHRTLN